MSILQEVIPSLSNRAFPDETEDHWVALDCGGFTQCAEETAQTVWGKSRKPRPTIAKKTGLSAYEQRRLDAMGENAIKLVLLGLVKLKMGKAAKARRPGGGKAVCPVVRHRETIPAKKLRFEPHPLLQKRVAVLWEEIDGPTYFYGTVTKYDSSRGGAPFFVKYEDGEAQWEPEVEPVV